MLNSSMEYLKLCHFPDFLTAGLLTRLGRPLAQFVEDHHLGEVFIGDVGFQLTWNPDTVLGPDVAFISKARLEEVVEIKGYWQGPPDLAVEVYSPGYRPGKVSKRISRLFSFGTKQVWIVDLKHSTVGVYRSQSDITTFSGSDYLEAQDFFRVSGFRWTRFSGLLPERRWRDNGHPNGKFRTRAVDSGDLRGGASILYG